MNRLPVTSHPRPAPVTHLPPAHREAQPSGHHPAPHVVYVDRPIYYQPAPDTEPAALMREAVNLMKIIVVVMIFFGFIAAVVAAFYAPLVALGVILTLAFIVVCAQALQLASVKGSPSARWARRDW